MTMLTEHPLASIRVLLGDDHRIVREGLKQVLADAPEVQVVAEAATGPEVLDRVAELDGGGGAGGGPGTAAGAALDVVLLDIAMPGMDGLDVLQTLRRTHPRLPVLMLSTYPERQYAVRCIKLGASGYLNKSADPDDMIAAVRKVAAGGVFVTPATAEALAQAVGQRGAQAGPEALSHREHQVFRLLIQGLSVTQIGAQLGLAGNTVSTYRARILEKTGTRNDVELALYAERQGSRCRAGRAVGFCRGCPTWRGSLVCEMQASPAPPPWQARGWPAACIVRCTNNCRGVPCPSSSIPTTPIAL
jgi:DNA-binding NarL/FixJ family response regulator